MSQVAPVDGVFIVNVNVLIYRQLHISKTFDSIDLTMFKTFLHKRVSIYELEGCIVWNDTIQHSPKAVRYPCTSCLLPAFDDVSCLRLSDAGDSALSAALLIFSF